MSAVSTARALGKSSKWGNMDNQYYCSSEDDDKWEAAESLVNCATFGWTEDGRCGYAREEDDSTVQSCPRPIPAFRLSKKKPKEKPTPRYICKKAAAGSRHSLFLMIDSAVDEDKPIITEENKDTIVIRSKKRHRKVMISGLNQVALCEEAGIPAPEDVPWPADFDRPTDISAGRGTSFIITKNGHLYSFGHGLYGVLGHGDDEAYLSPRRVLGSLTRLIVTQVSAGGYHACCRTEDNEIYSWGRNNKGQLGIGMLPDQVPYVATPTLVEIPSQARALPVLEISCGHDFTTALLQRRQMVRKASMNTNAVPLVGSLLSNNQQKKTEDEMEEEITRFVYAWGEHSRGQLGSGDGSLAHRPQENRWVTRLCRALDVRIQTIAAGGAHVLALIEGSGQVISWGAGDYGQLGHGYQFDIAEPRIINQLDKVTSLTAGHRHSLAVCAGPTSMVFAWGANLWGELGLGDTAIRLQPTKITAVRQSRVRQLAAGERHSIVVLEHRPLYAKDVPVLHPYFEALEQHRISLGITPGQKKWTLQQTYSHRSLLRSLQHQLGLQEPLVDPKLMEDPMQRLPDQLGQNTDEVENDVFERGLQYCLDTKKDPNDWRRAALEACFEVNLPNGLQLKKVCLSCARNCLYMYRLRPFIRPRQRGDTCDCRTHSGRCVSKWSTIREAFDHACTHKDRCLAPRQIRPLLKKLRAPFAVETADVEAALQVIADGFEDADLPRILPVPFEKWYRKYYDENDT